jgi:hypothetical protein
MKLVERPEPQAAIRQARSRAAWSDTKAFSFFGDPDHQFEICTDD